MSTNKHGATGPARSRENSPDAERLTVADLIPSDGLVEPAGDHDRQDGSATVGEEITSDRLRGAESRAGEHPHHHGHEPNSEATMIKADGLPADGVTHGRAGDETTLVATRVISDGIAES